MFKKLTVFVIFLVFLILPCRILAGEPEKPFLENIVTGYFLDVERQMRQSGFDIKQSNEFTYVNPRLILPKEISDWRNSYRDTRVPADFEKILLNAGIHSGYRLYNNSILSGYVNRQLAELKKSLEDSGLKFLSDMIDPEIKLHTGDDPYFTHGYLLEKPIITEVSTGSRKNGVKFGLKTQGLDWPVPKIQFTFNPFKIEAEYSASDKEATFRFFELNKTHLKIEYEAKTDDMASGTIEATAAILKIPGVAGKIFLSGDYDFKENEGMVWIIYIVRF